MRFLNSIFLAAVVAVGFAARADEPATIDLTKQEPPDIRSVRDDPIGRMIKYGHALFTDTAKQIGPATADPTRRYAGNNLTCQNCHLQGGTQAYAMPMTGVWGQFPQYRGREGEVGTLEDRINGCMERSMNGRALPLNSLEMKAFLIYMKWLSTGIPDGAKLVGAGTLAIRDPNRAANPAHGAQVYAQNCAVCHGSDGQGQRNASGAGYQFPPLWGPDSYNDGAGMARLLGAAAFIQHNMPLGTTYNAPVLNDDDAYDVAGYVDSQSRPRRTNLDKDFPNLLQKPVDTPYGPYADGFSEAQHKLGPYGTIRAKIKELTTQAGHAK